MKGGSARLALLLLLAVAGNPPAALAQADEAPATVGPAPPGTEEPALPAAEPAPLAANPNPLSTLDIESLSATRTLPLFTPSRSVPVVEEYVEPEPVAVAAPVVEEPPPVPPALRLIGVIMTSNEDVALLSDENTGEIHRIRPDEAYEGWTMRIVDGQTVEFRNEEQIHKLGMFEPGSSPPQTAQPAMPQFNDGHAFDVPTGDESEMMGGDLDYGGEMAVDGDGNPIEEGFIPEDGQPDNYETPSDYQEGLAAEEYPPEGEDQSNF